MTSKNIEFRKIMGQYAYDFIITLMDSTRDRGKPGYPPHQEIFPIKVRSVFGEETVPELATMLGLLFFFMVAICIVSGYHSIVSGYHSKAQPRITKVTASCKSKSADMQKGLSAIFQKMASYKQAKIEQMQKRFYNILKKFDTYIRSTTSVGPDSILYAGAKSDGVVYFALPAHKLNALSQRIKAKFKARIIKTQEGFYKVITGLQKTISIGFK